MKRYIVTDDQLKLHGIEHMNFALAPLEDSDERLEMLRRAESNCRQMEVPDGDFMVLDGHIIENPEGG